MVEIYRQSVGAARGEGRAERVSGHRDGNARDRVTWSKQGEWNGR